MLQLNTSAQKISGLSHLWTEACLTRVKSPHFVLDSEAGHVRRRVEEMSSWCKNTTATWPVTSSWLAECPEQRHLLLHPLGCPNIATTDAPNVKRPFVLQGRPDHHRPHGRAIHGTDITCTSNWRLCSSARRSISGFTKSQCKKRADTLTGTTT